VHGNDSLLNIARLVYFDVAGRALIFKPQVISMNFRRLVTRQDTIYTAGFIAILAVGIVLRCYQLLMGRSLWEDEAHLALNFISKDYIGLLKPLEYIQAAPPLFLLTTKTFALLTGYSAVGLRMLPFLTNVLTLPLFYYVLKDLCSSRLAALAGFFLFAINVPVIYYSSELKTYGVDVAVFVLIAFLTVSQNRWVAVRRYMLLAVAGSLSLLYSNVAFIILFCAALCMAPEWIKNKQVGRKDIRVLAIWAATLVAYYLLFIFHHPYAAAQRSNYMFAFPPLPLFSDAFNRFVAVSFNDIIHDQLLYAPHRYGAGYLMCALLITGIVYAIYRKQYKILFLGVVPMLLHFTLSLFHIYPFWGRLILYTVPSLMLLTANGMSGLIILLPKLIKPAGALAVGIACAVVLSLQSVQNFPLWFREIRPAIAYINRNYPNAPLFITTPYTLYKYYQTLGVAKNDHYEGIPWNIDKQQYDKTVWGTNGNYLLLHADDTTVDGYGRVLSALKASGSIVKQFRYKTYVVSEVRSQQTDPGAVIINTHSFQPGNVFDLNGEQVAAIWTGTIESKPIALAKGSYKYAIYSKGTPVAGVYPQLAVSFGDLNGNVLFFTTADYKAYEGSLTIDRDTAISIRVKLCNDAENQVAKEDRNAFIHHIVLSRLSG